MKVNVNVMMQFCQGIGLCMPARLGIHNCVLVCLKSRNFRIAGRWDLDRSTTLGINHHRRVEEELSICINFDLNELLDFGQICKINIDCFVSKTSIEKISLKSFTIFIRASSS